MDQKIISESFELLHAYRENPEQFVHSLSQHQRLPIQPILRTASEIAALIEDVPPELSRSAAVLSGRLEQTHQDTMHELRKVFLENPKGPGLRATPIRRVGICVPRRLPSTAYTFLSAARAAGVPEIVVYLVQNENAELDPLSALIARSFGAQILGGPARVGFPVLAFGYPGVKRCDLICGPCGARMNVLKHLCALTANCGVDMHAGPSELAIILEDAQWIDQSVLDIQAQIEHGPDSKAYLFAVGDDLTQHVLAKLNALNIEVGREIHVKTVASIDEATESVRIIAPETLEVYSHQASKYASHFCDVGIAYLNLPSALGDYGGVGRGCADPTGGAARGQSGISPLTFLRFVSVVDSFTRRELQTAAISIAKYEGLLSHRAAIEHFQRLSTERARDFQLAN